MKNKISAFLLGITFLFEFPASSYAAQRTRYYNTPIQKSTQKGISSSTILGITNLALLGMASMITLGSPAAKAELQSPFGIHNEGVACYMNAALQQLYRCKSFRDAILNLSENQLERSKKVWALKKIFELMKAQRCSTESTAMAYYKSALGYIGRQEDSHEFMFRLLEECNNLLELNKKSESKLQFCQEISAYNQSDTSLIDLIKNNTRILNMSKYRQRLKLSDKDCEDIDKILAENKPISEDYDINTRYICTNGGQTIMIHVQRASKYSVKIKNLISVPLKLDLKKDLGIEDKSNNNYELSCVTVNYAATIDAGHYIVYARDHKNIWYKINDARVSKVSYEGIKKDIETNGTILTYTASNPN